MAFVYRRACWNKQLHYRKSWQLFLTFFISWTLTPSSYSHCASWWKKLLLKACQRGNFDFGGCTKPKPKWWEVKLYYHSFMVLSQTFLRLCQNKCFTKNYHRSFSAGLFCCNNWGCSLFPFPCFFFALYEFFIIVEGKILKISVVSRS